MAFRRVVLVLFAIAGVLLPARAHADDVGSQVLSMINAARGTPLALHQGLLWEAQGHSQYMSQQGSLNHDNADERANSAAPDPAEANGAPDDGFAQAGWCENATYVTPAMGDPAKAIYNNWRNSAPHNACMMNTGKNVGAVGVYWDGSYYWATFVAESDSTPPGGTKNGGNAHTTDVTNPSKPTQVTPEHPSGITTPKATPAPAPAAPAYVPQYNSSYDSSPVTSASPSPSPKPKAKRRISVPADVLSASTDGSPADEKLPGFGMQELAGIIAALVFGGLLLERRLYMPDEPVPTKKTTIEDDDEPFRPKPSMELEGAGHP